MDWMVGVPYVLFIVSMILFVTAELFAIVKLRSKGCTSIRALYWFEVLGFIDVKNDRYYFYDKGSDKLKECEKQWWDAFMKVAQNGMVSPKDMWDLIVKMESETIVRRYIYLSTLEKITRLMGLVLYGISFVMLSVISGIGGTLIGSLVIAAWNGYKLYYVYGVVRPIVKAKVMVKS